MRLGLILAGLCCIWLIRPLAGAVVGKEGGAEEVQPITIARSAPTWPVIDQQPFGPGEKFTYNIKYEFLFAGWATLEVSEGPELDGRSTLRFASQARSNGIVDLFFKVRDFNSSWVDRKSIVALASHQNLREGRYRVVRDFSFDHDRSSYTLVRQSRTGDITTRSGALDGPVVDILSSFYYARTLPLALGEAYEIQVFSERTMYDLRVEVDEELETITVPAGRFECIRIRPFLQDDGLFKARDGRMTIWLTNDAHRMPVLVRSQVSIGAFEAELAEYVLGPVGGAG